MVDRKGGTVEEALLAEAKHMGVLIKRSFVPIASLLGSSRDVSVGLFVHGGNRRLLIHGATLGVKKIFGGLRGFSF